MEPTTTYLHADTGCTGCEIIFVRLVASSRFCEGITHHFCFRPALGEGQGPTNTAAIHVAQLERTLFCPTVACNSPCPASSLSAIREASSSLRLADIKCNGSLQSGGLALQVGPGARSSGAGMQRVPILAAPPTKPIIHPVYIYLQNRPPAYDNSA